MTKRETIDEILSINISAEPRFLAKFADKQLSEYLTHLQVLSKPRMTGKADRYAKYFRDLPKVASRPRWRTDTEHVEEVCLDEVDQDAEIEDFPAETPNDEQQALELEETFANDQAAEELLVQAAYGKELGARDVDLAVGPEEREQLLCAPTEIDQQTADGESMDTPFTVAASHPTAARTDETPTRSRTTPYSTDASPAPAGISRRRAKVEVHAHAAGQASTPQLGQESPSLF